MANQNHTHTSQSRDSRRLYGILRRRSAGRLPLHRPLQSVAVSRPAPAAVLQRLPLVAGEGGADGEVLEDGVSAEEVHSEGQLVGSHPLQLGRAQASAALQFADAAFLRGACGRRRRRPGELVRQDLL